MSQFRCINVPMMDSADLFVHLGFIPGRVLLTNQNDGQTNAWFMGMVMDAGLEGVANGTITLRTDKGISLCQFTGKPNVLTADPTTLAAYEFWKANGIRIHSDWLGLASDIIINVMAWEATDLIVGPCTHDGTTSGAYKVTDKDVDFMACQVSKGHIVYNQTNGNIGFVGSLEKFAGTSIFNTINCVDSNGDVLTAADFDTSDVFFVYPPNVVYPRADLGYMT